MEELSRACDCAGRFRVAVSGQTAAELIEALERCEAVETTRPRLALAVPGMGTEPFWLVEWSDLFSGGELQRVAELVELPELGELLASAPALLAARDVTLYQRVLFAAHLLLLEALEQRCGLPAPDCVASFSAGEPTAAFVAGAVGERTAAALSRAMAACNGLPVAAGVRSTMVVVGRVPLGDVRALLAQHGGEVGAFIGRDLHAVCGREPAMRAVAAELARSGAAFVKETGLPVAFHSELFEAHRAACDAAFGAALAAAAAGERRRARVPWHSSVRGGAVADADALAADFWFALLRAPALSLDAMASVRADVFLELNCQRLYARSWAELQREPNVALSLPMLELAPGCAPPREQLAALAATLWLRGVDLNLTKVVF